MKNAVRQILLSGEAINPSPNSLFLPVPQWSPLIGINVSSDGIIFEDVGNGIHIALRNLNYFSLVNNVPYRWTVWVKPLARRFCYLTIAPDGGKSRFVTLWGLDGQGLLDTKQIGSTVTNVSTAYKNVGKGIWKLTFNFTITSGGDLQIPVIGLSNSATPTYDKFFDIPFQGLLQSSIQVVANECVPA